MSTQAAVGAFSRGRAVAYVRFQPEISIALLNACNTVVVSTTVSQSFSSAMIT